MKYKEVMDKLDSFSEEETKLFLLKDGGRIIYNTKSDLIMECLDNGLNFYGQCFTASVAYSSIVDII